MHFKFQIKFKFSTKQLLILNEKAYRRTLIRELFFVLLLFFIDMERHNWRKKRMKGREK